MKPRTRKATALPVQHILLQVHVSCSVQGKTAEKTVHVFQRTRCVVWAEVYSMRATSK